VAGGGGSGANLLPRIARLSSSERSPPPPAVAMAPPHGDMVKGLQAGRLEGEGRATGPAGVRRSAGLVWSDQVCSRAGRVYLHDMWARDTIVCIVRCGHIQRASNSRNSLDKTKARTKNILIAQICSQANAYYQLGSCLCVATGDKKNCTNIHDMGNMIFLDT
jgi:hypothetical protein